MATVTIVLTLCQPIPLENQKDYLVIRLPGKEKKTLIAPPAHDMLALNRNRWLWH